MSRKRTWSEADLRRAIKVVKASGLNVRGVEITPDGTVRVLTGAGSADEQPNPWDEVLSGSSEFQAAIPGLKILAHKAAEEAEAKDALQRWRAGRDIRKAHQLSEAKQLLATAAANLNRKALDQLYEGHRTRSIITIARVLGLSKEKLVAAWRHGLLKRDPDSRSVVYTKEAVLAALGLPSKPSS